MRVLVVGDAGALAPGETYHVGDEAMLQAVVATVRRLAPDAELTLTSSAPEWTARQYGVRSIDRLAIARTPDARGSDARRLVAAAANERDLVVTPTDDAVVAEVAASDVVVLAGAGNLCSLYPGLLQERLAIGALAAWRKVPLMVVSQTVGPILAGSDVAAVSGMLRDAQVVGVREHFSLRMLERLGVGAHLQPDDALPLEDVPSSPEPYIAVTAHHSRGGLDLAVTAEALDGLVRHTGWRLVFVPHFESDVPEWSDALTARHLAARLTAELEILPIRDVSRTIDVTSRASLIVSTRYHPLVFGLGRGVPSVGIVQDAYHHVKLAGVLAHAGLSELAVPASSSRLAETLKDVASRRGELAAAIVRHRQRWRTLRDEHEARLRAALLQDVEA